MQTTYLKSGAIGDGNNGQPVNIIEVGDPGQPTEILVHNGKVTIYGDSGQVLIKDGIVQANAIAAGAIATSALSVGARTFVTDIAITPTAYNAISWTSGTLYYTSSLTQSVSGGSTTGISTRCYVCLRDGSSLIEVFDSLEVASSSNIAVLAIVDPVTSPDLCKVTILRGEGTTISGDQITTGTINAKRIVTSQQSFAHGISFTSSHADECSWTSGTLYLSNGSSIAINSGTTGRLQEVTSPYTVDASTVALWHFNETTGLVLDNAEGDASWDITDTASAFTHDANGKFSYALGSTMASMSRGVVTNYSEMNLYNFTIEGWFKTGSTVTGRQHLIGRRVSSTDVNAGQYEVIIENGYLKARAYGYSASVYYPYTAISSVRVDDSAWHQFMMSYDRSGLSLKLYVDGILNSTVNGCTYGINASNLNLKLGNYDLAYTHATTDIDITLNTITTGYEIPTGTVFLMTTSGTMPGGLTASTAYYAIKYTDTSIRVASSYANAIAGTYIDITSVGTGTLTLYEEASFEGLRDEFRISNIARTMTAASTRYIYYSVAGGSTLQVSTSVADTINENSILLCEVQPQISGNGANLTVSNMAGTTINGSKITTPRIESPDGRSYLDLGTEQRLLFSDTVNRRAYFGRKLAS